MSIICRMRSDRKLLVDVLAVWFGIGAWIGVNGLFVQLPLLVLSQPEGWNLPSYLSVIVQLANVGPILYAVVRNRACLRDSTVVYGVMTVGTLALLLLAVFYRETSFLFGAERSVALFSLVFFVALVGCTSSVLFLPYMGNYREAYLVSYFVGEGLSGFLPSVVALVQGVGGNPTCVNQTMPDGTSEVVPHTRLPNFSTRAYFLFLFVVSAVSLVCFFLLNHLRSAKGERVLRRASLRTDKNQLDHEVLPPGQNKTSEELKTDKNQPGPNSGGDPNCLGENNSTKPDREVMGSTDPQPSSFSRPLTAYLLFLMAWVSGLGNGVFPSVQSYSCLPYGNVVYHLAATLGSMANPAACFLAFFLPASSVRNVSALAPVSAALSSYVLATALTSPEPPLVGSMAGEALIVICWVLNNGLISFVKMSIASLFRRQGGHGLFWCGALQQIGSAIAALVTFFLVNYAGIFTSYYPCQ